MNSVASMRWALKQSEDKAGKAPSSSRGENVTTSARSPVPCSIGLLNTMSDNSRMWESSRTTAAVKQYIGARKRRRLGRPCKRARTSGSISLMGASDRSSNSMVRGSSATRLWMYGKLRGEGWILTDSRVTRECMKRSE